MHQPPAQAIRNFETSVNRAGVLITFDRVVAPGAVMPTHLVMNAAERALALEGGAVPARLAAAIGDQEWAALLAAPRILVAEADPDGNDMQSYFVERIVRAA